MRNGNIEQENAIDSNGKTLIFENSDIGQSYRLHNLCNKVLNPWTIFLGRRLKKDNEILQDENLSFLQGFLGYLTAETVLRIFSFSLLSLKLFKYLPSLMLRRLSKAFLLSSSFLLQDKSA